MKPVEQMRVHPHMTVDELIQQMDNCGTLGAGRIGLAARILTEMLSDEECTVFLSLAGPLVPGGLRQIIGELVDRGYIDAIVTTGANIVHDVIEALGYHHFVGSFFADDSELHKRGIGRIGDVYVELKAYEAVEKLVRQVLDEINEEERRRLALQHFLNRISEKLQDKTAILSRCKARNVPIFSPGFLDSMIGLNLWTYSQTKVLTIDLLQDLKNLMQLGLDAKRSGAIILGGGTPKHHALMANILGGGVDLAVQITMDRPEAGGLSGAYLEEAISWGKIRTKGKHVTVIGDATVCFPMVVSSVLERISKDTKMKTDATNIPQR
jgi:deoxyhypusine synthase